MAGAVRLIDIILAPQAGGIAVAPAFSVVSAIVPGRWVLYVAPEHPSYPDVLAQFSPPAKRARRRATAPAAPRGARVVRLATGLSRRDAYRAASTRARRDFRGFSYNSRTGRAVLT